MYYELPTLLTCSRDQAITTELITKYINKHNAQVDRYKYLGQIYRGEMDIQQEIPKDAWKPDNRLTVNFPKYITDTFLGYFNGIPIKKSHADDNIQQAIASFDSLNDAEDEESELAKMACVYGRAYELVYQNEQTETEVVYNSPENMFIVYDDSIKQKPFFAVRYGYTEDNIFYGEVYTDDVIYELGGGVISLNNERPNPYGALPVIEYYFNEERMSIFESVISLANAYNKALSEKANDVEYFSDQYLAFLGAEIEKEDLKEIRSNRVINYFGQDNNVDVKFLDKPDSDTQTENLLDRMEKLIYQTSMVANISDESFGSSSGVALAYKLESMSNLALTFQRKFQSALSMRYKLFCSLSTNVPSSQSDAWKDINYTFTRNEPKDLKEQAETATMLMGITSEETALSVLSVVNNIQDEIKRINEEKASQPVFDQDATQTEE